MFRFKLRVHFSINIEVFWGHGGKMAYFFRFFLKKFNFLKKFIFSYSVQNMFWFKLRVHFGINIEVFWGYGGKMAYFLGFF